MEALVVDQARAAEMLDVSVWQLWQWRRDGRLRAIKCGKYVKYAVTDLQAFIDAHREGSAA